MSDNVGLSTPRGSGTSGYVQKNLAHIRPRDRVAPYPKDTDSLRHRQRQPDKSILEHDRKRAIEVQVFELRDLLEDQEYEEEEIEERCDALRQKLTKEMQQGHGPQPKRNLKSHQVHELADAKIKESEKLRKALKISKDYEEGGHWRRQEDRQKKIQEKEDEERKRAEAQADAEAKAKAADEDRERYYDDEDDYSDRDSRDSRGSRDSRDSMDSRDSRDDRDRRDDRDC